MRRLAGWREQGSAGSLGLPQASSVPPLPQLLGPEVGAGKVGEEGEVYFDNIRAYSPTGSCYFESPGEQGLWLN